MINSLFLLKGLQGNLRLKRDSLEQIQLKKLKALIRHAYKNVRYYRGLFDSAGLKPDDIQTLSDIRFIPITEKSALRKLNLEEKTAANTDLRDCLKVFTSGSTGMPTHVYFTRYDHLMIDMVYLRSFLVNGLRFRDKRAFILDPHSFETKRCWYHRLGLAAYENISCFTGAGEQMEALRRIQPDLIHGYPSSLALIALRMLEKGIKDVKPRLVSTSAELLHQKQRERINAAFGISLYDRYAARECGNIAWECDRHDGYHINIDTAVVEIVRDGKPAGYGETGDVIVTNLHSYGMPFIRYRIGDIGSVSDRACSCGVEMPLMRTVEGRDEDFIILKDGRLMSPMMVTGTLDYVPGIRQFRVVQESMDVIDVFLAKGDGFAPGAVDKAQESLREIFGSGVELRCSAVEDIPRESNGKVRAVVSKVFVRD
ncbi:MAG: phenylacetate--CoA ligase family protein [Nitrospiraceae bacterium]|nr:MAG: phenylacetate--CoA ligase family protein [Nitrospiraceae bacterium]